VSALPRVHAVTDDRVVALGDLLERAAAMARAAGPELAVHLRARALDGRALLALAVQLREVTAAAGAWLVVNGRADVAATVDADAVLSGRDGLGVADMARVAPGRRYARSVHDLAEAQAALTERADFLVAGAVFATASHPDRAPAGVDFVRRAAALGTPVIAIGGITPGTAPALPAAGAWGVAAIRALWDAADPAAAARAFLAAAVPDRVRVSVNGDPREMTPGGSLADLLAQLGVDARAVVVEHNRRIVRRESLAATGVAAGEQIELVHFVGGG